MSSTTLPVCPKTGSTSPSLTVHLCLHTAPGNRECAHPDDGFAHAPGGREAGPRPSAFCLTGPWDPGGHARSTLAGDHREKVVLTARRGAQDAREHRQGVRTATPAGDATDWRTEQQVIYPLVANHFGDPMLGEAFGDFLVHGGVSTDLARSASRWRTVFGSAVGHRGVIPATQLQSVLRADSPRAIRDTVSDVQMPTNSESIQALAVQARHGDHDAFAKLYDQLYTTIWRVCCSRLDNNHADADDAAQITFLRAHQSIKDYRGETRAEFMGWLCMVARNSCNDWVRREERWAEKMRRAMEKAYRSPFDWAQALMRDDRRWRCIWRELAQLSAEKREAFILRSKGFKNKEIASIMERPVGTINTWLYNPDTGVISVLRARCAEGGR